MTDIFRKPADALVSIGILSRAGVIDFKRPGLIVRAAVMSRRLGPVASPVALSALRDPDAVALVDEAGSVTYGELDRRSNALARALQSHGIGEGSKIGSLCRDHRPAVELMVAAGKLGARLVLLNTSFAKPQLADVAAREGIEAIVVDEEFAGLLEALPEDMLRLLAWIDDPQGEAARRFGSTEDLIAGAGTGELPLPSTQGGLVLLTSGTTGTPKGAPRTVGSPLIAAQFIDRVPHRSGDVVSILAPTFHGTGLSQFILALSLGSTVLLTRRFDAESALRGIERNRVSVLVLVPTMLQRILALDPEVLDAVDTSSLRIMMTAGAALPGELGDRAQARFGPVIHNLYGSTECAVVTVAMPEDWTAAPGTVGRPPRGIRVRLLDAEDREVTTPGVSGRIFVDNGFTFGGYTGGGTKPVVDGFMGTGDTGHWDDGGRLFIDGRDDDMIVSGGENVFPREIEELVGAMPGIADVATLPVEDEDFGTRLRMFVVADGSIAVTEDDVKELVRTQLARFKVPRDVVFVDAIPYNPTGKVARRELAKLAR